MSAREASLASSSSSGSLIKLDELSSFGATKRARLPALIKLNSPLADLNSREEQQEHLQAQVASSMPDFSESQLDKMAVQQQQPQQQSLPANVPLAGATQGASDKENNAQGQQDVSMDGFQVVDMVDGGEQEAGDQLVGPSLPAQSSTAALTLPGGAADSMGDAQPGTTQSVNQATSADNNQNNSADSADYASHLGDSLIEMIINLRNENQNLVRALETNNDYVKERLSEFKKCQEESKRREQQYAAEKAEHEHQIRKLQRQNSVMSERLKSMEAKLKDMKLEVSESLTAAHSSKASSIRGEEILYPELGSGDDDEQPSFSNPALNPAAAAGGSACATMQVDAAEGELYNSGDAQKSAPPTRMECDNQQVANGEAQRVASMTREQLSRRFDATKAQFLALDDPMKQCDQLEQQLNNVGKRDYEICLMQQQLNIYRQDFRLERMAKLEAKIQIEKLKNEIDRLCLERAVQSSGDEGEGAATQPPRGHYGPATPATAAADGLIGKLGHHLGRKAIKSAAKAAKYAAKQAHLEEKTAAALARAAAAKAAAVSHLQAATASHTTPKAPEPAGAAAGATSAAGEHHEQHSGGRGGHHHRRGHHGHHHRHHSNHAEGPPLPHSAKPRTERMRGVGSEIVSDLINLGNKTMLTGYKMASTHVNLALDKLNQYEQQQAAQLAEQNKAKAAGQQPSAPPMDFPSVD